MQAVLPGAATRTLALFFGTDHVTFSIDSLAANLTLNPRPYSRFSVAADDVVDARVFMGIHFRFADEVGRKMGDHVGNWAFSHFLRPVNK